MSRTGVAAEVSGTFVTLSTSLGFTYENVGKKKKMHILCTRRGTQPPCVEAWESCAVRPQPCCTPSRAHGSLREGLQFLSVICVAHLNCRTRVGCLDVVCVFCTVRELGAQQGPACSMTSVRTAA